MAVNQKMFAEIHELITVFPELHEQRSWETDPKYNGLCGTTRCIAGWATWLGAKEHGLLTRKREMVDGVMRDALVSRLGLREVDFDALNYLGDYPANSWAVLGATLLGLSDSQAYSLFHDLNNERVAARVKSFAETGSDISDDEFGKFENWD